MGAQKYICIKIGAKVDFSRFYKRKQYLIRELKENKDGELSNKCQCTVWIKHLNIYVYRKRNCEILKIHEILSLSAC